MKKSTRPLLDKIKKGITIDKTTGKLPPGYYAGFESQFYLGSAKRWVKPKPRCP